jgi:hypothetical protein
MGNRNNEHINSRKSFNDFFTSRSTPSELFFGFRLALTTASSATYPGCCSPAIGFVAARPSPDIKAETSESIPANRLIYRNNPRWQSQAP